MPRHEEDLSAKKGQAQPYARISPPFDDGGRACRAEKAPKQGAQEACSGRIDEIGEREVDHLATFPRAARLRRRRDFLAVQQRGRRLFAREWVILALENQRGSPRLGVTVSSKVANAVGRNRAKRWAREAYRELAGGFPAVDVLAIARSGAVAAGFEGAKQALTLARVRLCGLMAEKRVE